MTPELRAELERCCNISSLQNTGLDDVATWWARHMLLEDDLPHSQACSDLITVKTSVIGHPVWVSDTLKIVNYVLTAVFAIEMVS